MKIQDERYRVTSTRRLSLIVGVVGATLLIGSGCKQDDSEPLKPMGTPDPTRAAREASTPMAPPDGQGVREKMDNRFKGKTK